MAKRAISGLLIVILLCGGAFYYYTTTPGYAVARIQDALAEGDVATFEKYVDLDRLLETLLDDLMAQAIFDSTSDQENGFEAMGKALGQAMFQNMKPALLKEMNRSIIDAVEQGSFDEIMSADGGAGELAGELDGVQFDATDYDIQERGATAIVSVPATHTELDIELVYEFEMNNSGGLWRVVALKNAAEITSSIDQAEARKLAEHNAEERRKIDQHVEAQIVEKRNESDRWEINKAVILAAKVRNIGDSIIEEIAGTIRISQGDKTVYEMNVSGDRQDGLKANQETTMYWKVEINPFKDGHEELWDLEEDELGQASLEIRSVSFQNDETLEILDRL